jgi:DNA-binding beta-propeller fold protein YncE
MASFLVHVAMPPPQAALPRPIPVAAEAIAIAITPDGKTAYAVSLAKGTVTPIATATNTPGRPIKVGRGAFAIVIAP